MNTSPLIKFQYVGSLFVVYFNNVYNVVRIHIGAICLVVIYTYGYPLKYISS